MARTEAPRGVVAIVAIVVVSSLVWFFFVKTVPPGRVGVATLFGNVVQEGFTQGIHVPVNPLYGWTMFDAREKTHLETANVPSQDQLQTRLDVSVQYRIDGVMAPRILEETGDAESAVRVHLVPKLRSLLREQGKSIVGYGAPAKGNTLLNYCGVRTDLIDYTVDRSPHKQERFLPGVHLPIYSPEQIQETKPDYVLILPWNLKDEIVKQMSYVRDWGGQFVVPIPRARVLP